ncbi:hypothetical protein D3C76_293440 [compost metagenome]
MIAPSAVRNRRELGQLVMQWGALQQSISHARLRAACPCSQCRARQLRGGIAVVAEDVRVERMALQGYGIQLVFSDGHERGIYPWRYLYDLLGDNH